VPRLLKYIAYLILFVMSFLVFIYWSFPYDRLKDRLISGIERQLGGKIEVSAQELEPYWFTGAKIKNLEFSTRDAEGQVLPAMKLDELKIRAALFSLIFGRPNIKYRIRAKKGEIEGRAKQTEDGFEFDADFDDFDIATLKLLASKTGLNLSGKLDGYVELKYNQERPARSSGKVALDLANIKIGQSTAKLGPMDLPLPPLTFTSSKGSTIKLNIGRGTMVVDQIMFKDSDLELDLTGKVFLSNTLTNCRFNVRGNFKPSEALEQALPFIAFIKKEKKPDGSFPLSVTGRISSPNIKIGTFSLPM
jgi:type II secretion system protein N